MGIMVSMSCKPPILCLLLSLALVSGRLTFAEDRAAPTEQAAASVPLNFPSSTLGGVQFWSDELVFRGWRVQQNALSGHYRLLDEDDFRMAWGTFDQCRARFDELRR